MFIVLKYQLKNNINNYEIINEFIIIDYMIDVIKIV